MRRRSARIRVAILLAGLAAAFAAVTTPAAAAPSNDAFSSATSLSGTSATLTGTNVGATGESGEPNHAGVSLRSGCSNAVTPDSGCLPSVWWSWTAPSNGTVSLDLCGSDYNTTLAVYTGSSVGSLTAVRSNDDAPAGTCAGNSHASQLRFTASSGTTYRIAVSGFHADTGSISGQLTLTSPPPNDDFSTSMIAMSGGTLEGSNVGATGELGEPNHAGTSLSPGCTSATTPDPACMSSVWFTYTPLANGPVTIDLCSNTNGATTFDTTLAVYTGNGVGALTEIASNDQTIGTCANPNASKVVFTATLGNSYQIAVAGFQGATGEIHGTLNNGVGTPMAPTVTTGGTSNLTTTSARLAGTINPNGQTTRYHFDYSTDSTFATQVQRVPAMQDASVGSGTDPVSVSQDVTGLTPGVTYYYRLVGANSTGTTTGGTESFTTHSAPVVSTDDPSGVNKTGATLHATVNPKGDATTYHFEYGTDTSYGSTVPVPDASAGSGNTGQSVSAGVTALTPDTTYHYRVVATNSFGTTAGADKTFTTRSNPIVTTDPATNVTNTSATLNGMINPKGDTTTYHFEYGPTTGYGTSVPATDAPFGFSDSSAHPASQTATSLTPGTTYHYRLVATNSFGTTNGPDQTFTTKDQPAVTTDPASAITASGATLNGTINPMGDDAHYQFEYGTDTTYGAVAPVVEQDLGASDMSNHSVSTSISHLTPGQTYHYRLVAHNTFGTTNGNDQTFVAADPPAVNTTSATDVNPQGATLNGTVNPNGVPATYHFEYGKTTAYGTSVPASDAGVGSDSTSHPESQAVTGLDPGTTYHFRIVATNSSGTTHGDDVTFTTPAVKPIVATGGVTSIKRTSAMAHGTVNPGGAATTYRFDYGKTNKYGSHTASTSIASGNSDHAVTGSLGNLTPGVTYHYRLVASNSKGFSSGADHKFTATKPSNGFKFVGKPATPNDGSVTITLKLAGPGKVRTDVVAPAKETGTGSPVRVAHKTVRPGSGGETTVTLKPNKKGRVLLQSRHSLDVTITVTFTPTHGDPHTRHAKATLQLK